MFFVHITLFVGTVGVMVFWLSNLLLSLFYGLPRSLVLCTRRKYSWKLPLHYVLSALIWMVVPTSLFIALGYFLQQYHPSWLAFLLTSWGFNVGQFVGVAGFFLQLFTHRTRADTRIDFESIAQRYLLPP
jgi:hypothetical protein